MSQTERRLLEWEGRVIEGRKEEEEKQQRMRDGKKRKEEAKLLLRRCVQGNGSREPVVSKAARLSHRVCYGGPWYLAGKG